MFYNENYGDFSARLFAVNINLSVNQFKLFEEYSTSKPENNLFKGDQMVYEEVNKALEYFSIVTCPQHETKHFFDFFYLLLVIEYLEVKFGTLPTQYSFFLLVISLIKLFQYHYLNG